MQFKNLMIIQQNINQLKKHARKTLTIHQALHPTGDKDEEEMKCNNATVGNDASVVRTEKREALMHQTAVYCLVESN